MDPLTRALADALTHFVQPINPESHCKFVNSQPQRFETFGPCDLLDELSSPDYMASYRLNVDLFKTIAIGTFVVAGAAAISYSLVFKNQNLAMSLVFFLGYAGIIFEECLAFNKSGIALLMAVTLWTIHSLGVLL